MKKIAIILFNLGGPDTQAAVRPFLFNLFNDPAILRLPVFLRVGLAWLIAWRRQKTAQKIYAQLGGGSPILPHTQAQAAALENMLNSEGSAHVYRCFIAMRYWHPFAGAAAREVKLFAPDETVLLPLYPQFSGTTTASSLQDWRQAAARAGLVNRERAICCYPTEQGFIAALAASLRPAYVQACAYGKPRLLLSAHGLPEKIVAAGDPYPLHCRKTADAVITALAIDDLDAVLCYQSRVGPLAWIKPATDAEIRRAGHDRVPLVIAPIAFVSDHSETLVEIDIEYRHLAQSCGVPYFASVPAVGCAPAFIEGLARMVRTSQENTLENTAAYRSGDGRRVCPSSYAICPCPASN